MGQKLLDAAKTLSASGPAPWGPPAEIPLGDYGDEYLVRAIVAQVRFGANRREDAVYLNTARDNAGRTLDGQRSDYVLHLPARMDCASGSTDCVAQAFWSLSIYDTDGYFVDNPLGRYLLGTHSPLRLEPDGSLELYLQADEPEDPHVNWLPIPQGEFEATMRMYCPSDAVIDGDWTMPPLQRVR